MDAETIKYIRMEVRRQMNVLLGAKSSGSDGTKESVVDAFPGYGNQPNRPIVAPYGFASRAPDGTKQMTGRVGDDPASRVVLGHMAQDRPAVDDGEAAIYSSAGYKIRVFKDKIQVAKGGDFETVPVGETLRDFLKALIEIYVAHTHEGNLGYETTPPDNFADAEQLKTENLDNDKILAKDGGRY